MGGRVHLLRLAQGALLVCSGAVGVWVSQSNDWEPPLLAVALLGFALVSQPLALGSRKIQVNSAFMAIVLACVVLGPTAAGAIGAVSMAVDALRHRRPWAHALANVSTYAAFPIVAGVLFKEVGGARLLEDADMLAIPVVAGVFLIANFLNFALIALDVSVADGQSVRSNVTAVYADVFPVEFATGLLTGGVAFAYASYGSISIVLLALVALVFQYLMGVAGRAVERGSELEERNQQLAALHIGLIGTLLKTLSLRDHMTARHSAAVARYSREMAVELGLSGEEQDLIHTAALFHDIGKFIFPDSILLADSRLSDEDFAIVRRHPEVGAEIIGEIDGYGPVAEVIRSHHERIDGNGYPDRIAGADIPLGSRIIAVADVYDVITARDTYRKPVTTLEALAELRRVAGTQLDGEIVELFIGIIENRGVQFRHSTSADFEAELQRDRRVRDYAAPRVAA